MSKIRLCTLLKPSTMDKLSAIRREIVGGAYHSGAICRVIDACVEQADAKKVIQKLKKGV